MIEVNNNSINFDASETAISDIQYLAEKFVKAPKIAQKKRLRAQINMILDAMFIADLAKYGLLPDKNED